MLFLLLYLIQASPCAASAQLPAGVRASMERACAESLRRYTDLFGTTPDLTPAVSALINSDTGLSTPNGRRLATIIRGLAAPYPAYQRYSESELAHEIAHVVIRAHADQRARDLGREPVALPEWFVEGIAIRLEHAEQRQVRSTWARELQLQNLAEVLNSGRIADHKRFEGLQLDLVPPCTGRCPPRLQPDQARLRRLVLTDTGLLEPEDTYLPAEDYVDYVRSLASYTRFGVLTDLIVAVGGPEAMPMLLDRLLLGQAGLDALLGLPGLPSKADDMESLWRKTLASTR